MDAGSEWISPSQNEPTPPPLESTWDVPHMVGVVAEAAAAVVVVHAVSQGTMTGATTEATIEVTTGTMIVMRTESTDRTDADLHLLITAGAIALDPDPGPTPLVTTELHEKTRLIFIVMACVF